MFPVATQTHNHWNRLIPAALSAAANGARSDGGSGRHRRSSNTLLCSCPVKDVTTPWVHLVKHLLSGRQNQQETVNASNSCDRQMTSGRVPSLKAVWGRSQREEQEVDQEARRSETIRVLSAAPCCQCELEDRPVGVSFLSLATV